MDFDEYLRQKKIDPTQFAEAEPDLFTEWQGLFEQMSADSFTAQKKFLLNPIRRKYLIRYFLPDNQSIR